jgi:hypothetical protein
MTPKKWRSSPPSGPERSTLVPIGVHDGNWTGIEKAFEEGS